MELDRPLRLRCGCGAAYDAAPARTLDAGPHRTAATTAVARRDGVGPLVRDLSGGDVLRHARIALVLAPERRVIDWALYWTVVIGVFFQWRETVLLTLLAAIGFRELQRTLRWHVPLDLRIDADEVSWGRRFLPRRRLGVTRVRTFESTEDGVLVLVDTRGRRRPIIRLGADERDSADWLAWHLNDGIALARIRR
jgi:hypothetical protein